MLSVNSKSARSVRNRIAARTGFGTLATALALAGCASQDSARQPQRSLEDYSVGAGLDRPDRVRQTERVGPGESADREPDVSSPVEIDIPSVSRDEPALSGANTEVVPPPRPKVSTVDAATPSLPVGRFVDLVFGQMLQVPYSTGPGVAEKSDLVQIRSSGKMSSETFLLLVSETLEKYDIRVIPTADAYEIVTDDTFKSRMPQFLKSRSRADVSIELRPIVQFVELNAISANEMQAILTQAFPKTSALKIEANPRLNVVTLTGLVDDVDAALSIIDQLDELAYAGTKAERYSPVFWSANDLANEVTSLLEAEGWQASTNKAIQKSILVLPVEYSNDLFIFSRSAVGLTRARFWLSELDRASRKGDAPQVFVFSVQNVDAELLAATVNAVLLRRTNAFEAPSAQLPAAAVPATAATQPGSPPRGNGTGNLVVNRQSNQIIFSGTPSQYDEIRPLLTQLDHAAAEVLIEVTVAEITLNDNTQYGVEFFINSLGNTDFSGTVENAGLGLGGVGTNIGIVTGNINAAINFFANNNLLNVLSTPRLLARSGGSAQIQVGSDVPVITSQRASSTQDGTGATDILQSVEYRSTGVLLSIEPIVFGDNRIDLSITQEVSTAIPTTTSQIASPTISNRSVTTQLSLEDGATAILGGLIQSTTTRDETGTPILKDIPFVGNLFRNTTLTRNKTELIILITAYVVRGREDKQIFTNELIERFNDTERRTGDLNTYLSSIQSVQLPAPPELAGTGIEPPSNRTESPSE